VCVAVRVAVCGYTLCCSVRCRVYCCVAVVVAGCIAVLQCALQGVLLCCSVHCRVYCCVAGCIAVLQCGAGITEVWFQYVLQRVWLQRVVAACVAVM